MESIKSSGQRDDQVNELTDEFATLGYLGKNIKSEEGGRILVFFSLDMANSNIQFSQICQIAAQCGDYQFNVCMLPTRGIAAHQSTTHGFKISQQQLWHYGQQVDDVRVRTQEEGLREFLEFLRKISGGTRSIVLAAHNIFGLHYPNIIARLMRKFGLMEDLQSLVLGFVDTYSVFYSVANERGLVNSLLDRSFTLDALAKSIGINLQQPHAVENVGLLVRLINHFFITNDILLARITDFDEHIRYIDLRYDLDDVVKTEKLQLIASAGISIQMLKNEYRANGNVTNLLTFQRIGNQVLREHDIQYINSRLADIIGGNW